MLQDSHASEIEDKSELDSRPCQNGLGNTLARVLGGETDSRPSFTKNTGEAFARPVESESTATLLDLTAKTVKDGQNRSGSVSRNEHWR